MAVQFMEFDDMKEDKSSNTTEKQTTKVTKSYTSDTPEYGVGITCEKIESTKYQEEAENYNNACNAYLNTVSDGEDYLAMIESNLEESSQDPLMQSIVSTYKVISDDSKRIVEDLTTFPSQIASKAQELDEAETKYNITKTTYV